MTFFANFPLNSHLWLLRALYVNVDIKFQLKTTIKTLKIALSNESTNWIQEFLYRTSRLVPSGTNWKQEFCYRGPPRAKRHSVSERRKSPLTLVLNV